MRISDLDILTSHLRKGEFLGSQNLLGDLHFGEPAVWVPFLVMGVRGMCMVLETPYTSYLLVNHLEETSQAIHVLVNLDLGAVIPSL
ncbi:unnamed protein product [Camellia sinensis]